MQCRECGFSVESQALFCPNCGVRLASESGPLHAPTVAPPAAQPAPWSETVPAPVAAPSHPPKVVAESPVAAAAKAATARPGSKPSILQSGEVFAERYRVEKFLGQGSLCNAYLCRDGASGNREAVLKIMHPRKASEPGLEDSFLFLAGSVSKYDHKGIAKTLEWGQRSGVPFYTMEWVSGSPLRMWLLERLTFENRVLPGLGLLRSLLEVFEAVHERGCYGCLKPENVFVTLSGPVVMDFGVVGFLSPQEFEFNAYARRYLPYMAPELRQDWSNLIPHSDYYSLGAILYEILVGRAPAPQLRLPSEMSDIFGIEADEIILKAMAPNPLDRFGTLEAFRNAVESLQASLLNARPAAAPAEETMPRIEAPVDHVRPQIDTDARTIHNPDMSFSTPVAGVPVLSPVSGPDAAQISWTAEPEAAPSEKNSEDDPYRQIGDTDGNKTLVLGRESEAAHAQRKFSRPIIPPLPEFPAPDSPGAGAAAGVATAGITGPDALEAPSSRAWESLTGKSLPGQTAEEVHEPVPAWLWISLALAGCCMVVLSAYFGLLLPR
jgi:serine/threonine protein kinase